MCSRNYQKKKELPYSKGGGGGMGRARVCQVNVTRITRKVFEIWNFVFGNLSFVSGRHAEPFVRTWNRAQNWGRKTGPLVENLVAKLTTAAYDLVAKNIFWSQMATRRPDFSGAALPIPNKTFQGAFNLKVVGGCERRPSALLSVIW